MSIRLPIVTDFPCAHPGCGAVRGIRCTFHGFRLGHPIRRQRLLECLDRRIGLASGDRVRLLADYRAKVLASWEPRAKAVAA